MKIEIRDSGFEMRDARWFNRKGRGEYAKNAENQLRIAREAGYEVCGVR